MESLDTSSSTPPGRYEYVFRSPTGTEYVNPFLLTEQIPYEIFCDIPEPPRPLSQVWLAVEKGIASKNRGQVLAATVLAKEIANDHENPDTRLKAAMFGATTELIVARASESSHIRTIPRITIWGGYRRMGRVLDTALRGKYEGIHDSLFAGNVAEMVVYSLIARAKSTKNIPYLGSAREEASSCSTYNHDIYTMRNHRQQKIAAQVKHTEARIKKSKKPSPFIARWGVDKFVENALPADMLDDGPLTVMDAAALIAGESSKLYDPSDKRHHILGRLSLAAITLLVAHRDFLRNRSELHRYPYTTLETPKAYQYDLRA